MILRACKYLLGVAFVGKSRKSRRNPVSTIESCERVDSYNSCYIFSFSI